MKFRRVLLTVFVLSLTLCALFINASAVNIVDSGKCGDNLTWTIDSEKTLTISGTGEMYDYTNEHRYDIFYGTDTPWHDKTVLNVVIDEGVTSIGANAFAHKPLKTIYIPASITKIGDGAFAFDPGNGEGAYYCGWEYCHCIIFQGSRPEMSEKTFLETGWDGEETMGYDYTAGIYCFYPEKLWEKPSGYGVRWVPQEDMSAGLSGPLKDNATWHWDNNGTLTVSGNGSAWFESDDPLWEVLDLPVKRVVVESGITSIGWMFFSNSDLENIILPDTLTTISEEAFANCKKLTDIIIPNRVATIGAEAFYGCSQLKTIVFEGDAPAVSDCSGFDSCKLFTGVNATAVYPANNRTWTSQVMKSYGGSITWNKNVPLAITTQPKTTYAQMGKEVEMKVTAEGAGLRYQWYEKNAGEAEFTKCSNTTDTYRATMSSAVKDRMVCCEITDCFGNTVKSNKVTMRLAATITKQPVSVKAAEGEKATVKLSAAGDGLTYTWYHASAGSSTFSKTTTFQGDTYSVEMTKSRDGRQIYCVVKDKYGKSHKSDVVTLSMIKAPKITVQPKTTYTRFGDTAKVTVKAEGDGLTYQWYYRNADQSTYAKSSNQKDTYKPVMNATSKDRRVYCVITDIYGNTVQSKTVILRMAATVTGQPKTVSGAIGDTVKTVVKAKGDGLTYQWYVKNKGQTAFAKSSVTSAVYSCKISAASDDRQAYCVVTDKYGKKDTSGIITIQEKVRITTQPKTTYAKSGSTARTTIQATGDGLTYTWYVRNAGAGSYSKSSVTKSSYSTTMNTKAKDRSLYCVVTDRYGNSVKSKAIVLRMQATITRQPKDMIAAKGASATAEVQAAGDGLTYQWYVKNPGASKFTKSSITKPTYTCTMSAKTDGRKVYCVVTDQYGKTDKSATVTFVME